MPAEFRAIFEAEHSYVMHSLRRLGVREADLPDITQEVFLTVHSILSTYDPRRPLRPWLFGIAWRCASRYRNAAVQRHEVAAEETREEIDPSPALDEQVARRQAQRIFLRALDAVEQTRRPVFVMMEIDDFSAPEVAEVLAIPLNTVYSRLRLAREEFTRAATRETGAR